MVKKKAIGKLLIEYGLISGEDVEQALKLQKEIGVRLGELLVRMQKIRMEDLEWILSKQLDIPFVFIDEKSLDEGLIKRFPIDFLLKNKILPVFETDAEICIVTADPFNEPAFEYLGSTLGKEVKVSSGSAEKIEKVLKRYTEDDGEPVLVSCLQNLITKIRDTSFYRIDFVSGEDMNIHVFGNGISKTVASIDKKYTKERLFMVFDALHIPFLYSEYANGKGIFLSVYPVVNQFNIGHFPAVLGAYGLYRPEEIILTDALVHGLPNFFHSEKPLPGHPFLALTKRDLKYQKTIFTVDSAPRDNEEAFIKGYVPEACGSCAGGGCEKCSGLGYLFKEIEGLYPVFKIKNRID